MSNRQWAWLLARLLAAGLAVVVLLGRLPQLAERSDGRGKTSAAFTPLRVERLADDRVADAFAALPLEEKLLRVGWDHSILSVDLGLVSAAGGADPIWRDAARLVRLSFGQLTNVHRLLLRVYLIADGGKTLLMSGDTSALDWKSLGLPSVQSGGRTPVWIDRLQPEWTPQGQRWLRYIAKS